MNHILGEGDLQHFNKNKHQIKLELSENCVTNKTRNKSSNIQGLFLYFRLSG